MLRHIFRLENLSLAMPAGLLYLAHQSDPWFITPDLATATLCAFTAWLFISFFAMILIMALEDERQISIAMPAFFSLPCLTIGLMLTNAGGIFGLVAGFVAFCATGFLIIKAATNYRAA